MLNVDVLRYITQFLLVEEAIMFENNINGEVLGSLTKDDLRDMNIRAIDDRILILNAIEALKH